MMNNNTSLQPHSLLQKINLLPHQNKRSDVFFVVLRLQGALILIRLVCWY
jgi:hypothetical protein